MYFAPEVIQTFWKHRQRKPCQPESGGVLLGRRRGKHFEVVHATSPFPRDTQSRTRFVRECYGHQNVATALWMESGSEVGYVGEWHTHPQTKPRPSDTDCREWLLLIARQTRGAPLVATVIGTKSLYVALLNHGQIVPLVEVQ